MTAIVLLTKAPRPGSVKTRLCPPLSFVAAAQFAEAAIADTMDVIDQLDWSTCVLAIDRPNKHWTRPGWFQIGQPPGGLDVRIGDVLERTAVIASGKPVLLIGMDTPHVSVDDLRSTRDLLDTHDAVIGPAGDGGFWTLGMRVVDRGLVAGVPMSTAATGSAQLSRLRAAGLSVALAPCYRDIDTIEDALAAGMVAPSRRFALSLQHEPSA